jgi:tRNA modification GTPase
LTGAGIDRLKEAIVARADALRFETGPETIAISARHAQALSTAKTALAEARSKGAAGAPAELLAADLRAVLAAYGEMVGRVDNERMLDQLFASFCIGK